MRQKPRIIYTLLCDDVRQEVGGKFSLMGLFETISAETFPAIHSRFAIVTEWTGGKGEFAVKTRLLTPGQDKVVSESESRFNLVGENQRHRDIAIRLNTPFEIPGTYWVEFLVDGERAGLTPLHVQKVSRETVH
jgi:hypothetical protein